MKAADKLLLFLGAEWLSAHPWRQGRLQGGQTFANDAAGREAFAELLRQYPRTTCYLLTDLVEEDFRFESIPHVSGKDHADIVGRKFEQFYRNTPLRHAQVQYREQEGRRDDVMLLSALTNPALITPWLELMLEREISVAGVYSVPLISRQLVSHIPSSHLLLLSWQKQSGLRETYYQDGKVSFSRLTPLVDAADIISRLQAELNRTYKYLSSLSLLPTDRPLDICIICGSDDRQKLRAALKNSDGIHFLFEDIREVADRIGFAGFGGVPQDSDATPLLLYLLGHKPPANQYANTEHTHFHDLWKVRHWLKITAAVVVFGCVAWSSFGTWQAFGLNRDAAAMGVQKEALAMQYRSIAAAFPPFPVPVDRMKAAVSSVQKLTAAAYSPHALHAPHAPQPFLARISQQLAAFPMIQVNSLSWRDTPSTAAATTDQEIILGGEILYSQSIRDTLDLIHQFKQALNQAGFVATPVTMPLDIGSGASLAGDLNDAGAAKSRNTAFVMKVIWNGRASSQNPQSGLK